MYLQEGKHADTFVSENIKAQGITAINILCLYLNIVTFVYCTCVNQSVFIILNSLGEI